MIGFSPRVPDRFKKSDVDLPINAINRNLIFGAGRVAAVYRVDTVSYEFLSLAEKQKLHGNLASWMIKAEADFSVYRVCREYSAEAYARDAMNLLDERFADRGRWERTVAKHVKHISGMHSFTPEVYFVVNLHPPSRLPWMRPSRDLGVLRDAEAQTFATLADHISCRRASTLELQWLLCRAAVRGVREPDVDPHWSPPALTLDGGVWSPGRADVQRFMPAVTEHRRAVLVEGDDGESQQTFFTIGKLPKTSDFPGNAELLFAPLERLDFPVDAVAHVRWVVNKKMLAICHAKGTHVIDGDWRGKVEDHPSATSGCIRDGYEISVRGLPVLERVTSDHRYWTRQSKKILASKRAAELVSGGVALLTPSQIGQDVDAGWVEAQDLIPVAHEIGYPIDMSEEPAPELPREPRLADPEWLWLIGYWWGNGHLGGRNRVILSAPDSKPEVIARIKDLVFSYRSYQKSGCVQISFNDRSLNNILEPWYSMIGKTPPCWVDRLPLHLQRALVQGYYEADGNRDTTKGCILVSVGLDGLLSLRRILARLGIPSSIRNGSSPELRSVIQGRLVNAKKQYSIRFSRNVKQLGYETTVIDRHSHPYIEDGYVWSRVESKTPVVDEFWPITTTGHTYLTAFGKSHNCDNSIKDARDELDDAAARFLSRRVRQRVKEVADVQEYFESEPFPPGLETFISFAVSAGPGDRDALEDRATRLKRAYRPLKLYRTFALQSDLFKEHLLRPDGATVRDYRRDYKRLMIAEQLAASMPIGANAGGSDTGYHIGYTIPGARRPTRYDPTEASRTNRAGAVMLNGTLGGGKTISVQLLAYLAALRGSIVVDVDPKKPVPDHSLERWPGLEGSVQEVYISNADAYRGQLDPLVFALPEMREELTSGYMMGILPRVKEEWQTEIIDAVRAVLAQPEPCSWKVIELLLSREDEHARAAGKALSVWADWGLGKCAFSRDGAQEANANLPVTMIKAPALTLPMPGTNRVSYDQAERFGVETFKLVIAKAMSLLAGAHRSVHKFLVIDEAHVLTVTDDGRRFLQQVIRMGRYMNITVVLASQLAGDLAELEQLIGVRFVFRQETDEQARINLRALGLDGSDPKLVETLRNFSDGRCLMRGLDGRVVAMRFDLVDPEILKVASTRPEDSVAALEEVLSA